MKITHKLNKKQCQHFHFRKRFNERIGTPGDKEIQKKILANVYNGRCSLYHKQSNTRTVLDTNIEIAGELKWIRFVYDSKQKQVVTVFPTDERGFPVESKFIRKELDNLES